MVKDYVLQYLWILLRKSHTAYQYRGTGGQYTHLEVGFDEETQQLLGLQCVHILQVMANLHTSYSWCQTHEGCYKTLHVVQCIETNQILSSSRKHALVVTCISIVMIDSINTW